jgi:sugar/nucleoside kinase (ribokinase family)
MFDIITIGTATRDVFLKSALFKVLDDPRHLKRIGFPTGEAQCFALGGKIEIEKPIFTIGGGATNAAITFARQGLKVGTVIKIGFDEEGELIISELQKENITVFPARAPKLKTAYSVILLAPGGERTILVYRGASDALQLKDLPFQDFKSRWAYIVPGNISFSIIEKIFRFFTNNGTLIAFNPSKHFIQMGVQKLKFLLQKTTVMILNREEAAYLTGIDYDKEKDIFRKLDEMVPGIVVMTDGSNGVMISDGYHIYRAGVFKEKLVVDRTGAGDAFGSGFVAGLIYKNEYCAKGKCDINNIGYAIRFGSANATSVIEKVGAQAGILTKMDFENSFRFRALNIETV